MKKFLAGCLLLTLGIFPPALNRGRAADKDATPEKARPATVKVTVDTSEVPELADWGKKAKKLVEEWYPKISRMLPSEGFTPPTTVKIVFKKDMRGVAYTSGRTIVIASRWVKSHPDDFGMVIHELTHVIQAYRGGAPSWVVEGIADYVRFFHYEPQTKVNVNPRRAKYTDSYRTTARFFAWIEKTHDKDFVRKLNAAVRERKYKKELFKTYTSKTVDELWDEFIKSLGKKKA